MIISITIKNATLRITRLSTATLSIVIKTKLDAEGG
jgi:hypothetical protein